MLENNYGCIVEISSFSAFTGGVLVSDYHASKAGLVNFCETLHYELLLTGKKGVKVTCVCPGPIATGLVSSDRVNRIIEATMGGQEMTAQSVAKCVVKSVANEKFIVFVPGRFKIAAVFSL